MTDRPNADTTEGQHTTDDATTTVEIWMAVGHSRGDEVDQDSEAFEAARDLRCFGADAFEEADRDPQRTVDLALEQLGEPAEIPADEHDTTAALLEPVWAACQGPRNPDRLPYDGARTRSLCVGDVVVVDGEAWMADRIGFERVNVDLQPETAAATGGDD